jgi:hypothetical protein
LPVVLYGYKTLNLTHQGKKRLLRRTCQPQAEEVNRGRDSYVVTNLMSCVLHWVLRYDQREERTMGFLCKKHKR